MQVEDVAGIRLPPRGAAEQERELPVRRRVLGQVVIDAEGVAAAVPEELPTRRSSDLRDVLERCGFRRGGDDHGRVRHGPRVLEDLDDLGHRRPLLADRDVEAEDPLPFLVDDCVDTDRGLPGPPVTDDQLALAAADRDHRVDRLQPGLERLLDRPAVDDARRVALDGTGLLGLDRALAVDRHPERVDDPPHQRVAHGNLGDPVRPLDGVALLDERVVAQEHHADVVLLEVQDHADDATGEVQQLAGHGLLEAVDPRDAVADLDYPADLLQIDLGLVARELALDDFADLRRLDHRRPREWTLPRCQTLANPRELTIQTALEDHAADLGDDPPQHALVPAPLAPARPG